jgi:hypothetical protein
VNEKGIAIFFILLAIAAVVGYVASVASGRSRRRSRSEAANLRMNRLENDHPLLKAVFFLALIAILVGIAAWAVRIANGG